MTRKLEFNCWPSRLKVGYKSQVLQMEYLIWSLSKSLSLSYINWTRTWLSRSSSLENGRNARVWLKQFLIQSWSKSSCLVGSSLTAGIFMWMLVEQIEFDWAWRRLESSSLIDKIWMKIWSKFSCLTNWIFD